MEHTTSKRPPETMPPEGWGADELTKYLDNARNSQWATFANKTSWVQKLIAIDAQFMRASANWSNPESEITAHLLHRCHAAFRASCGLAMAGQAGDTYVQCRAALEHAAYAVRIYRDPSLGLVWLNRHEDATSMKAQKEAFRFGELLAAVKAANIHASEHFENLYQLTIDLGAHPNVKGITSNMKVVEGADGRSMLSILQHADGPQLDYALKVVAQCGVVCLELLQIVFNPRFELLGINAAILDLRKGL